MANFLSFGGGVNSVALMLWLIEQKIEFEAVFADHGGDYQETYDYVDMLVKMGYPILRLDVGNLYDYCMDHQVIPMRAARWCTDKFKIRPLAKFYAAQPGEPSEHTIYLGIDYGEAHRAKVSPTEKFTVEFPLVEEGIDRKDCLKIIESHGLPAPIKSGCWFCPFQRKGGWQHLLEQYPCLFKKAQELEQAATERITGLGGKPYYLRGEVPLTEQFEEDQMDLFGDRQHCLCVI